MNRNSSIIEKIKKKEEIFSKRNYFQSKNSVEGIKLIKNFQIDNDNKLNQEQDIHK